VPIGFNTGATGFDYVPNKRYDTAHRISSHNLELIILNGIIFLYEISIPKIF